MKRKQEGALPRYLVWLTVVAGFALALILGMMLDSSLLLIALCYFTVLLSVNDLPAPMRAPFTAIGLAGGLITAAVLTYEGAWEYLNVGMSAGGSLLAGGMIIAALYFTIRMFTRDRLGFLFQTMLIFICAMRYFWAVMRLDAPLYNFVFMLLTNLIMLSIGVGFLIRGVKNTGLLTTNIGMVTVCALILMRFFDSDMSFLLRGVVFLIFGASFLLVNLKILRRRKYPKMGAGQ
jgi:hypothetical protein